MKKYVKSLKKISCHNNPVEISQTLIINYLNSYFADFVINEAAEFS